MGGAIVQLTSQKNQLTRFLIGNNAINLAQVSTALTKLTPAVQTGIDYVSVQLSASLTANDFSEKYYLGSFYKINSSDAFVTIYKPGTAFASYFADAFVETSGYYMSRGTKNVDQMNFTPPQFQGSVVFSANKISSSVTGSGIDFVSTLFESSQNDESQWAFIMPAGSNVSLSVPQLPEALQGFDIPVINGNPDHFEIYDYETVTGYDGLKTFMRNSTYGIDELYDTGKEYTDLTVFAASSSGRVKKRSVKHALFSRKKSLRGN